MQYIAMTSFTTEDKRYQRGNIYEASDFTDQNQIDEFISLNYIQVYQGGTGGTDNYQALNNKPMINGVVLNGNKSSSDLLIPTPINYQAGTGIDITGNVISATGGGGGETYTAGENITIDPNNEISAVDTKYTAGDNITITSSNVINAILDMTDYYNKTEVDDLIATMTAVQMEIVDTLPATGDSNTIYLVSSSGTGSPYEEYVYTNNRWVKIGDTTVDLSNYVTIPMQQSELAKKQDKLTSGDNIIITNNNKISAVDTKYYAGANVQINSGNVISATDTKYSAGDNVRITNTGVISATDTKYYAGDNIQISGSNRISATDTKYSAGSGIHINQSNVISDVPYTATAPLYINGNRVMSVDLTNYYNKPQVNALIENLDSVSLKVVLDLPTTGVKNVIYLVKAGESHYYNQWIYSDDEWYNIGTTQINLDDYYTKDETDDKFQEKLEDGAEASMIGDATPFSQVDLTTKKVNDIPADVIYDYIEDKILSRWEQKFLDKTYPVGSIYMSLSDTSPATLFGGTWKKIEEKFLLGSSSNYVVNSTGGSFNKTISRANLPNVNITTSSNGYYEVKSDGNSMVWWKYTMGGMNNKWGIDFGRYEFYNNAEIPNKFQSASNHTHSFDLNGNVTQTELDITNPYLAVNIWQRTA